MFEKLALPLMCAPMSFASSVPLASASARSGVVAGWQGGTLTRLDEFERYLAGLAAIDGAPPIVNLPSRIAAEPEGEAKLALLEAHRVPLVLSSLGDPSRLVERVHGWGGRVVQDVTTMRHAEKALAAGVDGLMVTCSGAGGHTGFLTPFAFVPAVRRIYDGLLIVAGGIADAAGMAGALALGGDIACMGTRFIATPESGVAEGHRAMIERAGIDRIVVSSAMNGVPANWIRDSLDEAGLGDEDIRGPKIPMPEGVRAWRDIYSAGQSVALIERIEPVADLAARLTTEFAAAAPWSRWRERLAEIDRQWSA
ncbi:nitronate monooxygenase [Novosphingobium sp.]|jgi:nitronate monooxygenase|uniref:NAD(P)H-dependent flavin oxidoreductase n=1 Tax=Novosphingobium sp. TaxID=1874826 RepID=UPI001ED29882|nr:nitronate monooxygenase [Novosphingobium sp.]MBK6803075.1 nitronate monooxygenase [Novosphingobium sp.]MBK9012076.1 nitronate monooxygenase [Novosphingobium sp.]